MNRRSSVVIVVAILALGMASGCMLYSSRATTVPESQAQVLPAPQHPAPAPLAPMAVVKLAPVNHVLTLAIRVADNTQEYAYTVTGRDFRFTTTDSNWQITFRGKIALVSGTTMQLDYDLGASARPSAPASGTQIGIDGSVVLELDKPVALIQDAGKAVMLTLTSGQ